MRRNKLDQETLSELVDYIRQYAPNVEIMADISTLDEAQQADKLDLIILAQH